MSKLLIFLWLCEFWCVPVLLGQSTQPLVAIHDSELTRALESMPASGATPRGSGTTGYQWWTSDWHYFVMPESMEEALRSDGTAFTVVGDSNITAGVLLANGQPRYPIVFSLASEAIRNDEIARLTNYVAAGGFLFIGSSAFTRNTNGTTRGDFAFANELGIHMVVSGLTNWTSNNYFTKQSDHRLVAQIPTGQLTWRMPASSEEIPWGISPSHPYLAPHDLWRVQASSATVLASGDAFPFLLVKPFGKGYFIYDAAFQPLIGNGGFAPGMYSYLIVRRAIEWAFESAKLPIPKLSPWPYPYDAAFMVRHDLEDFTNEIAAIAASAQVESSNGAKGDYYFCTGTVREDVSRTVRNNIINNLKQAVTSYGATIGPHNGGLKNPNNPSLVRGQYDYWHWGPDEALDVTPAGYSSGKAYAFTSISNAFKDIESWLSGTGNGSGLRVWVSPYFNATREDSYDIQSQLNVKVTGDQKLTPFPHWTLSTQTSGKRYPCLSEPVSDWYVGGLVAQSLEPWHPPGVHTSDTMHAAVDFYYNLGALINIYSHTLATGLGDAGQLVPDYITYCVNTNLHPRLWAANAVGVYQWWLQRSNAQISAAFNTNGNQMLASISIRGATQTNTAVEILIPGTSSPCSVQVLTNGVPAGGDSYRINDQVIRVRVGTTVTNAVIGYYLLAPASQLFSEDFDAVHAPALPAGWSTSASGAQRTWVTQTSVRDTSPNAAYSPDPNDVGITELVSPPISLPVGAAQLSFQNNYNLETGSGGVGYDGGVLEIKIGTNSFTDVVSAGGSFVAGGYNSTISEQYSNPLAGRAAWSGSSAGFISTLLNLPESASGQTIQFRWRCGTDNGGTSSAGWRIDTVTLTSQICSCCGITNTPPILPAQPDQIVIATNGLVVTNTASDTDLPAQVLSYQLVSPPVGAVIDATGVITWTPMISQVPSTNLIMTVVTDNGSPPLSATNAFIVDVTALHNGPTLPIQGSRTVNESTTLTVTNTASDADIPPLGLTYALLGAPPNAAISTNGIITWTPTEAQGPATNVIMTVVTDSGTPPLSATNSFTVVVNEVNVPPVLPAQLNRTNAPLATLSVTNTATDLNLPPASLSYGLLVAPPNAVISTNGIITWTPTLGQNNTTNLFETVVTNYNPYAVNAQHLTATNSFLVTVTSAPVLQVDQATLVMEGCIPTNGVIDPGETVTVLISLRNTGWGNTTNLVATLLATNGVTAPSEPQTYGVVAVEGGSVSEPFAFTANGGCSSNLTATLQLQDGPLDLGTASVSFVLGSMTTVLTQGFDSVTAPTLPAGWSTSATGAQTPWYTTNSISDTAPNAAFSTDANNVGLNEVDSPTFNLPNGPTQLTFRNNYNLECDPYHSTNGYDAGVLEIRIGTNTFTDITSAGGVFISGGYNAKISTSYSSPLAGRWGWSGNSGGYISTVVGLPAAAAGQPVQLRWLCGTDAGGPSGSGWRIDSIGVSGWTCCANAPPSLPVQPDREIDELTTLTVTNSASDAESPPEMLTYSLLTAPTNAVISADGVITWSPTQEQSPSTNLITTVVQDNGSPPLSATNTFTVVVREVNTPPVLPVIADQTVDELALLTVTNTAINSNIHSAIYGYGLVDPPVGAAIDANGIITWTPGQAQSPSTNILTTVVTNINPFDLLNPQLTATNSFTVIVREVNMPPVLPVIADRTVNELALLTVTNTATNPNIHSTVFGYGLLDPPVGAAIDAAGIITWTPSQGQAPSTNTLTTVVTNTNPYDLVNPQLMATNSFSVIVDAPTNVPPPVIQSITVSNGNVTITWSAVAGHTYTLQRKDSLDATKWEDVPPTASALGPSASATDTVGGAVQQFYRVVVQP